MKVLVAYEFSGVVRNEFTKRGPSENRSKERSKTYSGIAEGMATQWDSPVIAVFAQSTVQKHSQRD